MFPKAPQKVVALWLRNTARQSQSQVVSYYHDLNWFSRSLFSIVTILALARYRTFLSKDPLCSHTHFLPIIISTLISSNNQSDLHFYNLWGLAFITQQNSLEIHPSCVSINSLFLFIAEYYSMLQMYHSFFNHSLVKGGHLCCFQFLAFH